MAVFLSTITILQMDSTSTCLQHNIGGSPFMTCVIVHDPSVWVTVHDLSVWAIVHDPSVWVTVHDLSVWAVVHDLPCGP